MTTRLEEPTAGRHRGPVVAKPGPGHRAATRGRVLVIEDEEMVRDALRPFLEEEGYEVSCAVNGREALTRLYTDPPLPDVIVLDLRMPVMNGWEFRTLQKKNPKLALIPVVAISADDSEQAAAVSAQAYLRKPLDSTELLVTLQRVLQEKELQLSRRSDETERLSSLGVLAAGVAHEINNPLAFVLLNLSESIGMLRSSSETPEGRPPSEIELEAKARSAGITDMLEDCLVGGERIRETVSNLQRLSRWEDEKHQGSVDVIKIIEQSVSMVWNQIRHRARLVKSFAPVPSIQGNGPALGQVFLNLLVNAAQAIPVGAADWNEIRISTSLAEGKDGRELVAEISDSGQGIAPGDMSRVFEPFFTTKALGYGTGLGLSISRQTVRDHGGRITLKSDLGKGTVVRVILPIDESQVPVPPTLVEPEVERASLSRGRVLVIDDEPLICRIIESALKDEHDVTVTAHASEAVLLLDLGQTFDLILCDVVMPELGGPGFYATVAKRWPQMMGRVVFMTGGAFSPEMLELIRRAPTRILAKPFKIEPLKRMIREYIDSNTRE